MDQAMRERVEAVRNRLAEKRAAANVAEVGPPSTQITLPDGSAVTAAKARKWFRAGFNGMRQHFSICTEQLDAAISWQNDGRAKVETFPIDHKHYKDSVPSRFRGMGEKCFRYPTREAARLLAEGVFFHPERHNSVVLGVPADGERHVAILLALQERDLPFVASGSPVPRLCLRRSEAGWNIEGRLRCAVRPHAWWNVARVVFYGTPTMAKCALALERLRGCMRRIPAPEGRRSHSRGRFGCVNFGLVCSARCGNMFRQLVSNSFIIADSKPWDNPYQSFSKSSWAHLPDAAAGAWEGDTALVSSFDFLDTLRRHRDDCAALLTKGGIVHVYNDNMLLAYLEATRGISLGETFSVSHCLEYRVVSHDGEAALLEGPLLGGAALGPLVAMKVPLRAIAHNRRLCPVRYFELRDRLLKAGHAYEELQPMEMEALADLCEREFPDEE